MGKKLKPGNNAKHKTSGEPGEQLFPNKEGHHTSHKQTSKKYADIRFRQNNHSDEPLQRDYNYNLQETNCNNYSQPGLGHKV